MKSFLQKIFRSKPGKNAAFETPPAIRDEPVKRRPLHLATRNYQPLSDAQAVDPYFERLRRAVFRETTVRVPGEPPKFRGEHGRLAERRPYFYLAPWNRSGFLFELQPSGWVIVEADKIVATETFLRRYEPWDVVTLMQPDDGHGLVRLVSRRFGGEALSFPVYEEMLCRALSREAT